MKPPETIVGQLNRHTSRIIKDNRADWVREALSKGMTQQQIARKLKISDAAVLRIREKYGIDKKSDRTKIYRESIYRYGVRLGSVGREFNRLTDDEREKLFALVCKTNQTISAYLFDLLKGVLKND